MVNSDYGYLPSNRKSFGSVQADREIGPHSWPPRGGDEIRFQARPRLICHENQPTCIDPFVRRR